MVSRLSLEIIAPYQIKGIRSIWARDLKINDEKNMGTFEYTYNQLLDKGLEEG